MVRLSPGLFQPIAADDVAAITADVALAAPRNGIVEIAGPERAPLNDRRPLKFRCSIGWIRCLKRLWTNVSFESSDYVIWGRPEADLSRDGDL